jgi:hypothetical protein
MVGAGPVFAEMGGWTDRVFGWVLRLAADLWGSRYGHSLFCSYAPYPGHSTGRVWLRTSASILNTAGTGEVTRPVFVVAAFYGATSHMTPAFHRLVGKIWANFFLSWKKLVFIFSHKNSQSYLMVIWLEVFIPFLPLLSIL